MSQPLSNLIEELCSKQKLERDKALTKLLNSFDASNINAVFNSFLLILKNPNSSWESYHGILSAAKCLLTHKNVNVEEHILVEFREASLQLLTHQEVRVRQSAGEVLGALCSLNGNTTYSACKAKVLDLISSNLERHDADDEMDYEEQFDSSKVTEKINSAIRERRNSGDASQIFHDTAGWRNLETSMKCLEAMIIGCGNAFLPFIDQGLVTLIFNTLAHTNRFVRETGYSVCSALVSCGSTGEEPLDGNPITNCGDQIAHHLATGMADNWSQVRLAASTATRNFLMSLPEAIRQRYYPVLLPRICLNRYYVAEGVRLYSQETWRQVTGTEGRKLVECHIDSVVPYYIEATEADNHAVREAACACIAELAQKIPQSSVQPHVRSLLKALKVCFTDDSWPVRDAACLACGNFISCFPRESLEEMEALVPLFFTNLQDNIPSVRQGAAVSLASVVRTYEEEFLNQILSWIKEALEEVKDQPSESVKYGDLESGPAVYGVAKQRRDNDLDLHSNKQMYSCGSLAPKMGRGGGGCSDCRFRRPTQPWEKADGSLYLLVELSSIHSCTKSVSQLLPAVSKACSLKHYTSHLNLLETLAKVIPGIAKGLGKRLFKENLHLFLDALFYALESENALASSASSQCLNQLSQFLGPNILRGRVSEFNPAYLKALDANTFIAPF